MAWMRDSNDFVVLYISDSGKILRIEALLWVLIASVRKFPSKLLLIVNEKGFAWVLALYSVDSRLTICYVRIIAPCLPSGSFAWSLLRLWVSWISAYFRTAGGATHSILISSGKSKKGDCYERTWLSVLFCLNVSLNSSSDCENTISKLLNNCSDSGWELETLLSLLITGLRVMFWRIWPVAMEHDFSVFGLD